MINREIDLIDILYSVLKRWRLFLVFIIIGGVMGGVFSYLITSQIAKNEASNIENCIKKLESESENGYFSLDEAMSSYKMDNVYEMEKIRRYVDNEKLYLSQVEYSNNSRFMRLNPVNIVKIKQVFSIDASYEDALEASDLYATILNSISPLDYISQETGLNESDIQELYTLELVKDNITNFSVVVISDDRDECLRISNALDKYIEKEAFSIVNAIVTHTITKVSDFESFGYDYDVSNKQMNFRNDLKEFSINISDDYFSLTQEGMAYYDFLLKDNGDKNNTRSDVVYPKGEIKTKYVLLGMITLAIIFILTVILYCIMDRKLRSTDDLEKLANISVLANVNTKSAKRKSLFGWIDNMLCRLFDSNYSRFSEGETINFAVSAIEANMRKQERDNVCIIGCSFDRAIADSIAEGLKRDNYSVTISDKFIYESLCTNSLSNSAVYVVLESVGSTLYKELYKELQILNDYELEVMGAVLIQEV